ncbi:matrix metalloproteinase-14 isoform X2 [Drosophila gunungcola]|uniref:matrix metalloproteinase-14 isoform X2 n=1 Tax=Drosophila gunungcola TaxID=103775 RepID=UPI0022E70DEC|nr:matrix metalloproteinase-14 isoform X2 [Drosophila gunungcola]
MTIRPTTGIITSNSKNSNKMTNCQSSVFVVVGTLLSILAAAQTAPVSTTTQAEIYLSQFGYLPASARNPASSGLHDQQTWVSAIEEFQSFAGLNITGELDSETMKLMSLPRCGVRDRVGTGDSRSKRYALQGSRWRVKNLTYKISKYPKRLKRVDVDAEIGRAFAVWSEDTDLTFTRKTSGPVHIEIKFVESEHGDGDAFDGQGGTLAHAFFPVFGGDAHFDDAELWTIGSPRGTNLFQVAAHEFGHSLGLSHSDQSSALMAPFYRGFEPVFKLDEDDKAAIQSLYGRKTNQLRPTNVYPATTQRPFTPPKVPLDDSICKDSKVDTLFNSAQGETYAFKGDKYYKLTTDSVEEGYPQLISKGWPGLPGNIDAAFTYKNGKTYFFKGTQYWRYQGRQMDGVYPKEISEGFTGIPDHVDAAMVWGGNGKIYFFKGSKFWRFDPAKRPPVKASYPKPISNWEGVPNNLDAALKYTNGYTYFFKGSQYYRFHDARFAVDSATPPFPRPTAHWWFGCKNTPSSTAVGDHQSNDEPIAPEVAERTGSGAMSQTKLTSSSAVNTVITTILMCLVSKLIVS